MELVPANAENTYEKIQKDPLYGIGHISESSYLDVEPSHEEALRSEDHLAPSLLLRYQWLTVSATLLKKMSPQSALTFNLHATPKPRWLFIFSLYSYKGFVRTKPTDETEISQLPKESPNTKFDGAEFRTSYLFSNKLSWESTFGITERQKENAWSWVATGLLTYNEVKSLDLLFALPPSQSQAGVETGIRMDSVAALCGIIGIATFGNSVGLTENPFFISGFFSYGLGIQREQYAYHQKPARTQYYLNPQSIFEFAMGWKPYPFYLELLHAAKYESSVGKRDLSYIKSSTSLEAGWLF